MDREQRVCPVCGQPVQSVVRRHKTLGAWVPRWVPGPCHNPGCEAYVPEGAPTRPEERAPEEPAEPEESVSAEPGEEPGARPEPSGTG